VRTVDDRPADEHDDADGDEPGDPPDRIRAPRTITAQPEQFGRAGEEIGRARRLFSSCRFPDHA